MLHIILYRRKVILRIYVEDQDEMQVPYRQGVIGHIIAVNQRGYYSLWTKG